jgi:hypothetical protein
MNEKTLVSQMKLIGSQVGGGGHQDRRRQLAGQLEKRGRFPPRTHEP